MPRDDYNIPSVGRPGRLVGWYPTTLYWCMCVPGELAVVVLTGFNNPSACSKCGKIYQVVRLETVTGGWTPIIEAYLPGPSEKM